MNIYDLLALTIIPPRLYRPFDNLGSRGWPLRNKEFVLAHRAGYYHADVVGDR